MGEYQGREIDGNVFCSMVSRLSTLFGETEEDCLGYNLSSQLIQRKVDKIIDNLVVGIGLGGSKRRI